MKIYMAPMEGITGYNFRTAYRHHFPDADRYFTPFISTHKKLGKKVIDEILPKNNEGQELIPQVMVDSGDEFREMTELLAPYGYTELNINTGCPSGTVTSKHRGAGLLKEPFYLEDLMTSVFDGATGPVSIKTRIGWEDISEWERLAETIGQFPFSEVVIHTRVREEYYKGHTHPEAMEIAREYIHSPICYNGDLFTPEDVADICSRYPWLDSCMVGRGLLRRPWLIEEIKKRESDGSATEKPSDTDSYRKRTYDFTEELFETYLAKWGSEINTLYHMKEIWSHLGESFPEHEKELKVIRKTKTAAEYKAAVRSILL